MVSTDITSTNNIGENTMLILIAIILGKIL